MRLLTQLESSRLLQAFTAIFRTALSKQAAPSSSLWPGGNFVRTAWSYVVGSYSTIISIPDKEEDIHSPVTKDAFWAHIGWVLCRAYGSIQHDRIKDPTKFPELRFIDRFHVLPVLSLIILLFFTGAGLNAVYPALAPAVCSLLCGVSFLALYWSITLHFASTQLLTSSALGVLSPTTKAAIVGGYPCSPLEKGGIITTTAGHFPCRQGMYWWEFDMSYWGLCALEKLGLVWDLKVYPKKIYEEANSTPHIESRMLGFWISFSASDSLLHLLPT